MIGLSKAALLKNVITVSPFAPTDLPNLTVWLDASQEAYANNHVLVAGEFWHDHSGNARDFYPVATGPTFKTNQVSGKPVFQFANTELAWGNGTNQGWWQVINFNGSTLFAVFAVSSASAGGLHYANDAIGGTSGTEWGAYSPIYFTTGIITGSGGYDGTHRTTPTAGINTSYHRGMCQHDGINLVQVIDSNVPQSVPLGSLAAGLDVRFRVGRGYLSTGYTGTIAEVIIYNRSLTPTEIAKVNAYLTAKYGV